MSLSKRVNAMNESATLAMSRRSRTLISKGIDIINLSIGQPDFSTPEDIKEAAKFALDEDRTKYTPVAGDTELLSEISYKFKRENNLDYSTDEICVSTGAKHSIMNVLLSLINPGDEVILFAPYWVSYFEQVKFAGGIPVPVLNESNTDNKVSVEDLQEKISDKTKLIMFSSPSNPSGTVYGREDLQAFSELILKQNDLYVMSDEIYEYLNYESEHLSIGSLPGMKERTITVNGVAKGFAMTGWRIGYIGAPSWITQACIKIQGQFTSGANSVAQRATIKALQMGKKAATHMIDSYSQRRDVGFELLSKIDGIKLSKPKGAFYFFPDVSYFFGSEYGDKTINNAEELCMYILEEGKVACVGGSAFGNKNCIRLSYALSKERLVEAISRIHSCLDNLTHVSKK